ncbi:uncharacterized protein A1O9_03030 [Exophiala aquamarina CBS 119918]|uniref:Beta-glucuronidase C-terminal domain-containing protein n=1 Tax=Exophiala aquamarina CBS 119918 TaxID=1182545 RepID=A0A072PN02_9EURO|nr:uncharacterized protein A1O9_03030 [Exophiala aquamarina CBS 119918]KEF61464.1 hypothetical protein A1O9_03030 [Exophiala aquamarina CBS 119918]
MPIRIGGTTQDRATYDPEFDGYVSYDDPDPLIPPMGLTYGPKFFDLIREHLGCRATRRGFANAGSLQPYSQWQKPVAVPPWNKSQEGADNADWAQDFINTYKPKWPILSGGDYAVSIPLQPGWPNTNYLIEEAYNATIKKYTKFYNGHLYALSNSTILAEEMAHNKTVADLPTFEDKIALAHSVARPYILGETNFHGIDEVMDASFGAAIQTVDKSLKAVSMGLKHLYYHQGTINQANFNLFLSNQVNTPFYGGYFSVLALAGGEYVSAFDVGDDAYTQYVIYKAGKPSRIVLINAGYYSGSGTRSSVVFTLTCLSAVENAFLRALRLTTPSSDSVTTREQQDPLHEVSITRQFFSNADCSILGDHVVEEVTVVADGIVEAELLASEALLVYLP